MSSKRPPAPGPVLWIRGRMPDWKRSGLVAVLLGAGLEFGCRASGTASFSRPTDDDAGIQVTVEAGAARPEAGTPETAPHALLSAEPPHGPFSGGTLVLLRGNGFASEARVWFGETEIETDKVIAIDSHRIQVTAPAGNAGLADVVVQNGDDGSTRVLLPGGYAYDAFYADPASGPTSGGTLLSLHGQQTSWDAETRVTIDRNPCEIVELKSPTELVCRAPAGTTGSKPIRVTSGDSATDVLDAYSYGNSDNGFRGGLSGEALNNQLKVFVFDGFLGEAIEQAHVVVGTDQPLIEKTDASGLALVVKDELGPKQTITVAKRCFQPMTFVDVPVDTLTVYLDPVIAATCFSGQLEPPGGTPGRGATITGELVWPETEEFRRDNWGNIPEPKSPSEAKVAYVFDLASRPTSRFSLPSAVTAVTPDASGDTGFRFNVYTSPGHATLYALAGIQDQVSGVFTAYSMGLLRGVAALAGKVSRDVFILIDVPLDHAITLDIEPPETTVRGPDRLRANVAIQVGSEGYLLLPFGQSEARLGSPQSLSFVGVPPLVRSLAGTRYVVTARAVTGDAEGLPISVLGLVGTTSIDAPIRLAAFVEVPSLSEPVRNGTWNGRDLVWSYAAGGEAPDLTLIDVVTGGGLYNWRIVAPGGASSVHLPDLAAIDASIRWPEGQQNFLITRAKVADFEYGNLRYRNLDERGWSGYAMDAFLANF